MEFVWASGGLAVGVAATIFILNARHAGQLKPLHAELDNIRKENQTLLIAQAQDKRDIQNLQTQTDELKARETQLSQEFKTTERELRTELERIQAQKAGLASELETLKTQHQEWRESVESQWEQQFKAFLLQTLDTTKTQFEDKANKEFEEKNTGFEKKMKEMMQPLTDLVEAYKKQLTELGTQTLVETGTLKEQIRHLVMAKNQLVSALSHNKGRGDWGELELIRLLEDSGLIEGPHYVKQKVLAADGSRPDVKINLPGNRAIFVDCKALRVDLEDFATPDDPEWEREKQKKYARSLREAIKDLSSKEYQSKLEGTADFVVLYVPRESMLSCALQADPALFEEAFRKNVVISGPFNLIGLLKIVRLGWHQSDLSQNAHQILELGKELYKRAALFTERFEKVGRGIEAVSKGYNDAMISFSGGQGFIKQIQRLEKFGCNNGGKSLPKEVKLIDTFHGLPAPVIDLNPEIQLTLDDQGAHSEQPEAEMVSSPE